MNKEITFIDAWITGDMSGAIERSEKREQQNTVKNQRLPIKTNDISVPYAVRKTGVTDNMDFDKQFEIERENNVQWTKQQYEKMGIKIVDEYDDLFFNVILPEGWEIKATDHSMWNELFDNKNRKRISFFYKGSFYDRDAFSNFEHRYTFSEMPFDEYKTNVTYEERKSKEWYGIVYDCGKEIFRTDGLTNKKYGDKVLIDTCKLYLKKNYPLWEDINVYWD